MVSGLRKESQGERPSDDQAALSAGFSRDVPGSALFLKDTADWRRDSGVTDKRASGGCVVIRHCIRRRGNTRLNCFCRFNRMLML